MQFKSPDEPDLAPFQGQYCWMGVPDIIITDRAYDELSQVVDINALNNQSDINMMNSMKNAQNVTPRFSSPHITRQYIKDLVSINLFAKTFTTHMPMGLCIPSTCKAQDIELAINKGMLFHN